MNDFSKPSGRSTSWVWTIFVLGIAVGVFILLFAAANSDWIAIRLPTLPWRATPYTAAFEAKVWGVVLVSFCAGAATAGFAYLKARMRWKKRLAAEKRRVAELDEKLEKLNKAMVESKGRIP